MGFTTGLISGTTFTALTIYLTLSLHTHNRLTQAALLRQQASVLTNIIDPQPPAPPPTARLERAGILETVKDRWNGELERAVRNVYGMDWKKVREETEDRVRSVVGRFGEKGEEVKKDI